MPITGLGPGGLQWTKQTKVSALVDLTFLWEEIDKIKIRNSISEVVSAPKRTKVRKRRERDDSCYLRKGGQGGPLMQMAFQVGNREGYRAGSGCSLEMFLQHQQEEWRGCLQHREQRKGWRRRPEECSGAGPGRALRMPW